MTIIMLFIRARDLPLPIPTLDSHSLSFTAKAKEGRAMGLADAPPPPAPIFSLPPAPFLAKRHPAPPFRKPELPRAQCNRAVFGRFLRESKEKRPKTAMEKNRLRFLWFCGRLEMLRLFRNRNPSGT
jgi:hypothetical protein